VANSPPVTGGSKGFAIAVIVVGSLIFLASLFSIAQAGYMVGTGTMFGQKAMHGVMEKMSQGQGSMARDYDEMTAQQTAKQVALAPLQLGVLIPYAIAAGLAVLVASLLLAGRSSRVWLARLALAACLLRFGTGYAAYRVSAIAMDAMRQGFDRGLDRARMRSGSGTNDETLHSVSSGFGAAAQVMTVAFVFGQMALVAGFWGLVAFVFSRRHSPSPQPTAA
jgi:hypothetical protein